MKNYSFEALNDKEFESLAIDLIGCEHGQKIERFKSGKDKGVDGRYFNEGEIIIQCKHWVKSDYQALIRHLKKIEVNKVHILNPKKYILIISQELSRDNKKEIVNIFAPFILNEDDVWGREDLNDCIARNSQVERAHYKLWISSISIIQKFLNEAIYGRSKDKLDSILEKSHKYVFTDNHKIGWEILEKKHSIIITGMAGAGKTTLADHLCLDYIKEGYEFFFIEDDLKEAESVYNEDAKQIFYFDDFLGRNYLKAIENRTDSLVGNFINRIKKNINKRFILTSRTNILNQGELLSDFLKDKNIRQNEFELQIEKISAIEKAKILYTHLWFGNLSKDFLGEIYNQKRYQGIIYHKNFNPRLVNFLTDMERLTSLKKDDYWPYILSVFQNPKDVWRNVFNNQLDDSGRCLVALIAFNGKSINERKLKNVFCEYNRKYIASGGDRDLLFDDCMKHLTRALVNRSMKTDGTAYYDLFNPSIADFVYNNSLHSKTVIFNLLDCLETQSSLKVIYDLTKNKFIEEKVFHSFLNEILKSKISDMKAMEIDFLFQLGEYLDNFKKSSEWIGSYIELVKISDLNFKTLKNHRSTARIFVQMLEYLQGESECEVAYDLFIKLAKDYVSIAVYSSSEDEYDDLLSLCHSIDEDFTCEIEAILRSDVLEAWKQDITQMVIDHNLLDLNDWEYGSPARIVSDFVSENLKFKYIEINGDDVAEVASCCNLEVIEQGLYETYRDEERFKGIGGELSSHSVRDERSEIDDLFSRDDDL